MVDQVTYDHLVEVVAKALWGETRDWNGQIVPWERSGDMWDGDRRIAKKDAKTALAAIYKMPLVAAAPDLLSTAIALDNTIAGMGLPVPNLLKSNLRAAIAKATGQ